MNLRKDHYHISSKNKTLDGGRAFALPPSLVFRVTRTNNFRVPSGAPFPTQPLHFHLRPSRVQVKRTHVMETTHQQDATRRSRTTAVASNPKNEKTLSATDVLAPTTMKNAAKCDTSCELRNPVSHQNFERILHFPRGVCLLECLFIPTSPTLGLRACAGRWRTLKGLSSRRDGNVRRRPRGCALCMQNTTVRLRNPWNHRSEATRRHSPEFVLSSGGSSGRRFTRSLIIRSDLQSVKNTR